MTTSAFLACEQQPGMVADDGCYTVTMRRVTSNRVAWTTAGVPARKTCQTPSPPMTRVVAGHIRYVDALIRCVPVPPTATVVRDPRSMFGVESLSTSRHMRGVLYALISGGERPLADIGREVEQPATAQGGDAEDA
jgi:hypothetical protein